MNVPWIGLYEVRSLPGNDALAGMAGAFVNVVALGKDVEDFKRTASGALRDYDFEVLTVAGIGTVEERGKREDLVLALEQLAASLTNDNPVQLDEFQAYEQ